MTAETGRHDHHRRRARRRRPHRQAGARHRRLDRARRGDGPGAGRPRRGGHDGRARRRQGRGGRGRHPRPTGRPTRDLDIRQLELGSLASVRAFAAGFLADHDRLDLLILNAGVMACPLGDHRRRLRAAVRHQPPRPLPARRLLAARRSWRRAAPGGVAELGRPPHRDVDLDDPGFERTEYYDQWVGYGRAKTANVLFAVGFDRRLRRPRRARLSRAPGLIATELGRHLTQETVGSHPPGAHPAARSGQDVPQGAATSVWAATAPELEATAALYLEDCHVAEVNDDPTRAMASAPTPSTRSGPTRCGSCRSA